MTATGKYFIVGVVAAALLPAAIAQADCPCKEKRAEVKISSPCAERSPCARTVAYSPCAKPCKTECAKPCKVACDNTCRKVRADIEKLDAYNTKCTRDVCIKYQVEVDNADANQEYDLILQVRNCGEIVYEKTVTLDNRVKDKCHERVYKGEFSDELSEVIAGHKNFQIEGNVVPRGESIASSLDRERERVHTGGHGLATPAYAMANMY